MGIYAGTLREYVSVEAKAKTRDSYGGETETWTHSWYEWCSIRGIIGKEYWEASQLQSNLTHKIRMRYNTSTAAISPSTHRLKYDDRVFDIETVIPDVRHSEINLVCCEATT